MVKASTVKRMKAIGPIALPRPPLATVQSPTEGKDQLHFQSSSTVSRLILRLHRGWDQQGPGPLCRKEVTSTATSLGPSLSPRGLQVHTLPNTYLVSPSIVTLVNSNDTISKVSQCIKAVGPLLQGPKSYVLMVWNPERELRPMVTSEVHQPPGIPAQ